MGVMEWLSYLPKGIWIGLFIVVPFSAEEGFDPVQPVVQVANLSFPSVNGSLALFCSLREFHCHLKTKPQRYSEHGPHSAHQNNKYLVDFSGVDVTQQVNHGFSFQ